MLDVQQWCIGSCHHHVGISACDFSLCSSTVAKGTKRWQIHLSEGRLWGISIPIHCIFQERPGRITALLHHFSLNNWRELTILKYNLSKNDENSSSMNTEILPVPVSGKMWLTGSSITPVAVHKRILEQLVLFL